MNEPTANDESMAVDEKQTTLVAYLFYSKLNTKHDALRERVNTAQITFSTPINEYMTAGAFYDSLPNSKNESSKSNKSKANVKEAYDAQSNRVVLGEGVQV